MIVEHRRGPRIALEVIVAMSLLATLDTRELSANGRTAKARPAPKRVIIFQIDNLHYEAPKRLQLTNVLALTAEGTSVDEAYVPVPWHQTTGDYGKVHTTSLPNPVTFAGTMFLRAGQPMIQSSFTGIRAHVANSEAYGSLNPGFTLTRLDSGLKDDQILAEAKKIYSAADPPTFARIVLQDANDRGGALVSRAEPGTPWKNDIYGPGSPFIKEVKEADALLGDFISFLKIKGLWNDTLFIICADGASRVGWHPIELEDSARVPMIFVGPGVAKGKVIPYAETIDIVPTVAQLMNVRHPNPDGGTGRVLVELADGVEPPATPRYLKRFNAAMREFLQISSRMRLEDSEHPRYDIALMQIANKTNAKKLFFGVDRIMDWHEAGTMKTLVETNELIVRCLKALIEQETGSTPEWTPEELGCW
jgi:hypothetical protein